MLPVRKKKHAGVGVYSLCNLRIRESGTSLSGFIHFSSTGSFNGMFSFWITWRNMRCKVWAIFVVFLLHQARKEAAWFKLYHSTSHPGENPSTVFFWAQKTRGASQLLLHFCSRVELELENGSGGGSVGEGGATFVWKKEVGPPLKRLPVSDDWQKLGGERGGFYAHGTPKPRKTRGFCIRRTSKNMSSAITGRRTKY